LLSSLVYIGCFFGYVSISFLVDNLGRKRALLISYIIATVGMILIAVSPNVYAAGVGLFMMGMGSDSAINICFYFIT
jgi:MFS family permease